MEVSDRTADAMQAPIDKDPDGLRPTGHDGLECHGIEHVAHRALLLVPTLGDANIHFLVLAQRPRRPSNRCFFAANPGASACAISDSRRARSPTLLFRAA